MVHDDVHTAISKCIHTRTKETDRGREYLSLRWYVQRPYNGEKAIFISKPTSYSTLDFTLSIPFMVYLSFASAAVVASKSACFPPDDFLMKCTLWQNTFPQRWINSSHNVMTVYASLSRFNGKTKQKRQWRNRKKNHRNKLNMQMNCTINS